MHELEAGLAASVKAGELGKQVSWFDAAGAAAGAAQKAGERAAGVLPMLKGKPKAQMAVLNAKELVDSHGASGKDLSDAADQMHDLAQQLKDEGQDDAAKEVEALAGALEEAAKLQLEAEKHQAEQEVQNTIGSASAHVHALAQKLDGELGDQVLAVGVKVDGLLGSEDPDVGELQEALA